MNKQSILHKAKSNMAYAFDPSTLHLWLQTAKNDIDRVELVYGDPFDWRPSKTDSTRYEWAYENRSQTVLEKRLSTDAFDFYFISVKPQYKRLKYAFLLFEGSKKYLYGSREMYEIDDSDTLRLYNLFNYFNFPYLNHEDIYSAPSWVKDTVWYQIFPERFFRAKNEMDDKRFLPWGKEGDTVTNHMFFGGNIRGVIEKIPYLADLGINGIYFTPIFEAYSAHKYDTTDYFNIDPAFGTNEDFRLLVKTAHAKGIKIMLDAVFNHCGWFHPYWQDVVKHGKDSLYYECFHIRNPELPIINFPVSEKNLPIYRHKHDPYPNYETFAFTPMMPKWNTSHPLVRDHLLNAAKFWIDEFDIDGWRLDVANEVSHDFWRDFHKVVKGSKPDVFILGENWDVSLPWLQGDQFHAVMNYELLYPIRQLLGTDGRQPKIQPGEFKNLLSQLLFHYPDNILPNMFNLVGSHDTSRILNTLGENKALLRLAYVILFTMAGAPNIYYGDEIGMTGAMDPDNRRCMVWDESKQDLLLKSFFKRLITLRMSNPEFRAIDVDWLVVDDEANVFAYRKQSANQSSIVIINNSPHPAVIHLPESMIDKNLFDLMEERQIPYSKTISLNPYGFLLAKIRN